MTFREAINEVLIRLREDTIATDWSGNINDSSTVTDYQKVIGSLINDSKQFVESNHDWLALRETFTITTADGVMQYILGDATSGAGTNFKVLDVINRDTGQHLTQVNNEWLNAKSFPIAAIATGEPLHYAMNGSSTVVVSRVPDMNVDLYPVPTSVQSVNFNVIKTQGQSKTATDIIKVPIQPVVLGAWARAIAERGEDGGSQSGLVAQEAIDAMKQAIMIDSGNTKFENDWYIN
jgi:hypothetical protein